jgi:hypothetical protein
MVESTKVNSGLDPLSMMMSELNKMKQESMSRESKQEK